MSKFGASSASVRLNLPLKAACIDQLTDLSGIIPKISEKIKAARAA